MTRIPILKGVAQWVSERVLEIVVGALVIGTLFFLTLPLEYYSMEPLEGLSIYVEAVSVAAVLGLIYYGAGLFFIITIVHSFHTYATNIRPRLVKLVQLYVAHFLIFPLFIFRKLIFDDPELLYIVSCAFLGGLVTIIVVNTIGTRLIRWLLEIHY